MSRLPRRLEEHERHSLGGALLVPSGGLDDRVDVHPGGDRRRQIRPCEQLRHLGAQILGAREAQGGEQPDRDRFAVAQGPVPGRDLDLEASFFQTNHEGEFCEYLHRLPETADSVLLNAGAWTHYSWAIRDALEVAGKPAVEVHISDVSSREDWRSITVFEGLTAGRVSGKGLDGYREALEIVKAELGL